MDRVGRVTAGQILATAVLVLGAAIILPKVVGRGSMPAGPEPVGLNEVGEREVAPPPAVGRVDPARYRTTIQQLESELYAQAAPDFSTGNRISNLATQLGTAVLRRESRVLATQAGQRLMGFANRIGVESDVGYATVDLPRARSLWEDVRSEVFNDATWFRHAAR